MLLLFGEVGEVSLPLSLLREEESETTAIIGAVKVEVSSKLSLLAAVELVYDSELGVNARLSCVDVNAVDDTAVTNAAPIVPVGRADKRTLDCCCRIVVKGRLMGTREGSIRLLLCFVSLNVECVCIITVF